ncbi:MAG: hypothetical protein PHH98_05585 [Candidatus Gracilibacteria bacterium]|nr:hypothetical protein [Candidatus Gracilibacteria bacterium]
MNKKTAKEMRVENIKKLISDNLEKIKDNGAKETLKKYPSIIDELFIEKQDIVEEKIKINTIILSKIIPYVEKVLEGSLVEKNIRTAIYSLSSLIINDLNASLLLSKAGRYTALMTILRKIDEAIILINALSYEFYKGENKSLISWFDGELIMHGDCRKILEKMNEEFDIGIGVNIGSLESYLYQMTSQPAHNGYVSVIENISPFTEKFDFEGSTGFHRTISGIKFLNGIIRGFVDSLKHVYLFVLKDPKGLDEIENIYVNYWGKITRDSISEEIINKF